MAHARKVESKRMQEPSPPKRREAVKLALGMMAGGATVWWAGGQAGAQEGQPALAIGVVDMDRVYKEYKAFAEDMERLKAEEKDRQDEIDGREMLEAKEVQRLDAMLEKKRQSGLSEREQKDVEELYRRSRDRANELRELRRSRNLTPKQRQRRDELEKLLLENKPKVDELEQKYARELAQMQQSISQRHEVRFRAVVEELAKQKAIKLVLSKDALSVIFADSSLDITKEVLGKLNEAAPTEEQQNKQ